MYETLQTAQVPIDTKVVEVAFDSPLERGVLLLDRQMSMASTPVGDGHDGLSQPRHARLEARHPASRLASPPIDREAEQVEGGRALARGCPLAGAPEGQQAGLFRVQAQSVPLEATPQDTHYPFRVVLPLKADGKIIGIADQVCLALHPREHVALEPLVEHVVQVDVA